MRPGKSPRGVALAAAALIVAALLVLATPAPGGEPGLLGRLFRMGGTPAPPNPGASDDDVAEPGRAVPAPPPAPAATPMVPTGGPSPRLVPYPRVSRAVTDADPIITRIALGRSDDGTQFGMFLQVYADGTVIDSEGVHSLGREAIQGVLEALQAGELYRARSHCGGPPTDFVEQVQMIVYERSLGRLRANAFSLSGNSQGCDYAIRHLQSALDALQTKLSRPAPTTVSAAPTAPAASASPLPHHNGTTIPLNREIGPAGHD